MAPALYAIPFACSLAPHIALREAHVEHELVWVSRTGLLPDGGPYRAVNPKGKVAALAMPGESLLTENNTVLLAIADRNPQARLAPPPGDPQRYRLYEWLGFVTTELHKQVLAVWFDK